MKINLLKYQIKRGAFALILIDSQISTAFKLFKSYDHPDLNGTGKEQIGRQKENAYRQKIFETEREAYELTQESETLRKFTPKYFGSIKVDSVLQNGKDVSNQYLLDCCLKIAFIEGDDYKLNSIRGNPNALNELQKKFQFDLSDLLDQFQIVGIRYTLDSSAIINDHEFKIIDFATEDPYQFQPIISI